MTKIISGLKILGVWIAILLVIGMLFEVALHYISYPGKSTIYYIHHEEFGTWRKPNQQAVKVSECFTVDNLHVNSYGMRGAEPNPQKPVKVGFFGDSMTEGIQVNEQDHFVTRLNEYNQQVDYLNFSTSSTTTVYHLLNLKYHHRTFQLDKAVVFLYLSNDVQENSINLQLKHNGQRYYYPSYKPDGNGGYELDYDYRPSGWQYEIRDVLRKSLVFQKLYTIQVAVQQAKLKAAASANATEASKDQNGSTPMVYNRALTPEWQEAYDITDYTILQMKSFCDDQNIDLEFVLVPSVGELLNWENRNDDLVDWTRPYIYYKNFLSQHHIRVIDLYQAALQRVDEQQLGYPYFSYECDGHFAKAGHDLLYDALIKAGY